MSKGYHNSKTPEAVRDLWRTPKKVFDYYNRRYQFTTDVAASDENKLCEKYFTAENSAFDHVWGITNWCNPPFSDVPPWINKAIEQMEYGRITVMLLPADTSVKWFKLAFDNCAECHFISGRLAFINELTGKPVSGNNKGSVVFIFYPYAQNKQVVSLIDRNDMMRDN